MLLACGHGYCQDAGGSRPMGFSPMQALLDAVGDTHSPRYQLLEQSLMRSPHLPSDLRHASLSGAQKQGAPSMSLSIGEAFEPVRGSAEGLWQGQVTQQDLRTNTTAISHQQEVSLSRPERRDALLHMHAGRVHSRSAAATLCCCLRCNVRLETLDDGCVAKEVIET